MQESNRGLLVSTAPELTWMYCDSPQNNPIQPAQPAHCLSTFIIRTIRRNQAEFQPTECNVLFGGVESKVVTRH
jgi:hypothetical protein